jgi:hypothetical protein
LWYCKIGKLENVELQKMTFKRKHNSYVLIFAILIGNISCIHIHEVPKDKKTVKGQHGCDLIWDIRQMNRKEIYFHNTCTNQSCMVTWKSRNILGIWSAIHCDYIPPQGVLSQPIFFYDTGFEVDYYFQ